LLHRHNCTTRTCSFEPDAPRGGKCCSAIGVCHSTSRQPRHPAQRQRPPTGCDRCMPDRTAWRQCASCRQSRRKTPCGWRSAQRVTTGVQRHRSRRALGQQRAQQAAGAAATLRARPCAVDVWTVGGLRAVCRIRADRPAGCVQRVWRSGSPAALLHALLARSIMLEHLKHLYWREDGRDCWKACWAACRSPCCR
jgi:hypothetical protein